MLLAGTDPTGWAPPSEKPCRAARTAGHDGPVATADGTAQPEPASEPEPLSAAEEAKRRMREALDRKKGVQHPDDTARGGSGVRGRTAGTTRREFRRKSG